MDDLISRLESLFRLYMTAFDQDKDDGARATEQFRKGLQLLVAEYGPEAVDTALDEIPDGAGAWPSLH